MAVSEYFSDEELISQLRMFFTADEAENIDFETYLGQLTEVDDQTWKLIVKDKTLFIDKEFCNVTTEEEYDDDDDEDIEEYDEEE